MYPADPEKNGVTYLDESGKEIVSFKNYSSQTLVHFYYPGIDFLCHMEGDTGDGGYAIVHTKDARDGKLPDCLFVNNITPRASLFLEFLQSGTFEAEDEGGTYTSYCEDWRGYHTVYKFYDFSHTGNPVLYVYASPYNLNGNCSGFFVSQGEEIKKLCSSFNLGARTPLGYYSVFYYDREEDRLLYGEEGGLSYGHPEFSSGYDHRKIYDYDGEAVLKHWDGRIFHPEQETECFVEGERVSSEKYDKMQEYFQNRYEYMGDNSENY